MEELAKALPPGCCPQRTATPPSEPMSLPIRRPHGLKAKKPAPRFDDTQPIPKVCPMQCPRLKGSITSPRPPGPTPRPGATSPIKAHLQTSPPAPKSQTVQPSSAPQPPRTNPSPALSQPQRTHSSSEPNKENPKQSLPVSQPQIAQPASVPTNTQTITPSQVSQSQRAQPHPRPQKTHTAPPPSNPHPQTSEAPSTSNDGEKGCRRIVCPVELYHNPPPGTVAVATVSGRRPPWAPKGPVSTQPQPHPDRPRIARPPVAGQAPPIRPRAPGSQTPTRPSAARPPKHPTQSTQPRPQSGSGSRSPPPPTLIITRQNPEGVPWTPPEPGKYVHLGCVSSGHLLMPSWQCPDPGCCCKFGCGQYFCVCCRFQSEAPSSPWIPVENHGAARDILSGTIAPASASPSASDAAAGAATVPTAGTAEWADRFMVDAAAEFLGSPSRKAGRDADHTPVKEGGRKKPAKRKGEEGGKRAGRKSKQRTDEGPEEEPTMGPDERPDEDIEIDTELLAAVGLL